MNPRKVLGLRLWLVSHEMSTSGSPTEQFEICVSGACFRGIWIPECGGHVTHRHKEQRSSAAQKQASVTMSPLEEPLSTTAGSVMQLDAVANRAECILFSELGVSVATRRLMKECRKLNSMCIDADKTAVDLSSDLEPSVCYTYNVRYPLLRTIHDSHDTPSDSR